MFVIDNKQKKVLGIISVINNKFNYKNGGLNCVIVKKLKKIR